MATVDQIRELIDSSNEKHYLKIRKEIQVSHNDLSSKIDNMCADLNNKIDAVKNDNVALKNRMDDIEDDVARYKRKCQLLVRNVPVIPNEDLFVVFKNISHAIGYIPTDITPHIYRFGSKKNSTVTEGQTHARRRLRSQKDDVAASSTNQNKTYIPPIMLIFSCYWERDNFMSSYFNKLPLLNITDIGFNTTGRIIICENMTPRNHKIFLEALTLKTKKTISNVSVQDGIVFVKSNSLAKKVKINRLSDLQSFGLIIA